MSKIQALALATTNLHKALGLIRRRFSIPDLVLYEAGSLLDLQSKVVGVISAERGVVEMF
jgi:hypothetical protein